VALEGAFALRGPMAISGAPQWNERRGAPAGGKPFEPVSCSNVNISWRAR